MCVSLPLAARTFGFLKGETFLAMNPAVLSSTWCLRMDCALCVCVQRGLTDLSGEWMIFLEQLGDCLKDLT